MQLNYRMPLTRLRPSVVRLPELPTVSHALARARLGLQLKRGRQTAVFNLRWRFTMLVLQAVPAPGRDAYRLLRARIRQASTWEWGNKAKTRLRHVQRPKGGHISLANANGVLVAHVLPKTANDLFYLTEKFTGRLVAWFEQDLLAINIQFVPEPPPSKRRRRR